MSISISRFYITLKAKNAAIAIKFLNDSHEISIITRSDEFPERWKFVKDEIERTETYDLTFEELEYGATLAWRNEPRCPARVQWQKLVSGALHFS